MADANRTPRIGWRERACIVVAIFALIALFAIFVLFAVTAAAEAFAPQISELPQEPPAALVKATVANEVAPNNPGGVKFMFRSHKQTPKGSQTHLYVETNDAMAGMLIAVNDQSLTPQQQQTEDGHLAWLVNNPDQLHKKQAREKEDTDRTLRIMRALPEAFRYQYVGTETGKPGLGTQGGQLVRLKFTPNPAYVPPSHVEQVLTGMEGYLLIDMQAKRLARIDGTLFRDVTFGWGIFGRLDKGGHFEVQQADVGDGAWEITEMHLNITGKILLVKNLSMVSDEVFSDFQRMPNNLSFAQGVEKLKAEQEKLAHVSHSPEQAETKNPK
jgi:hypothetical protein